MQDFVRVKGRHPLSELRHSYLKSVSGQQLQIGQVVDDLTVDLSAVQGAEPLGETHNDSVL